MKSKKTILVVLINVIYISSIIILSYYIRTLVIQNNDLKIQLTNQNEEIIKINKLTKSLNNEIKSNDNSYETESNLRDLEESIENLESDSHYHY